MRATDLSNYAWVALWGQLIGRAGDGDTAQRDRARTVGAPPTAVYQVQFGPHAGAWRTLDDLDSHNLHRLEVLAASRGVDTSEVVAALARKEA